jgi:glucokinase
MSVAKREELREELREKLIVGVDLGGTKIRAVLADAGANIKTREHQDTCAGEGPEEVTRRIIESIKRLMDSAASPGDIIGIGIAAAGACEVSSGVVSSSPNLPGWHDVPLRDIIQLQFGIATYLDNDATLAALGEHRFGAGTGVDNLIYVTVSTGIGGGIIIDGKPYRGASGSAGEVGHMTIDINGPRCNCGNIGCWETFASGTALAGEAVRRIEAGAQTTILSLCEGDLNKVSAQAVSLAADRGDALAEELISRTGYYLGVGLVNLVDIFNPELILIGGGLSNMGQRLLAPALKVVKERAFAVPAEAVRIAISQLGADAGVLGAVALVSEERAKFQ